MKECCISAVCKVHRTGNWKTFIFILTAFISNYKGSNGSLLTPKTRAHIFHRLFTPQEESKNKYLILMVQLPSWDWSFVFFVLQLTKFLVIFCIKSSFGNLNHMNTRDEENN